jgi:hypothetical protein
MMREPRSVATPVLAGELCAEIQALVADSGHYVLLDVLSRRLGVDWDQLTRAVAFAQGMGWVDVRADSVALVQGACGRKIGPGKDAAHASFCNVRASPALR